MKTKNSIAHAALLAFMGLSTATLSFGSLAETDGKIKGKVVTSGDKGMLVNINTASQSELAAIKTIGPQVAQVIISERSKGAFKDVNDFAVRSCGKTSVNFEETSIVITGTTIAYRGGEPKAAGFRCAMGEPQYSVNNKKHNYVGHVTLLK